MVGTLLFLLLSACTTTSTRHSKTIAGHADSAAKAVARSESKDPKSEALDNYLRLGLGYLRRDQRQKARFNLRKALDLNPHSAEAHNGIALLYQLEQEVALAEQHFKDALRYRPDFTGAKNNYGIFLVQQQRLEEAHQIFLDAAKDIDYAKRGQIFLSLGMVAKELGRVDAARAAWEKALRLQPRLSSPYLELAEVYYSDGDYPTAMAYLKRYDALTEPSARGLWLAVRLERAFGNRDGEASKALALRKLFPHSRETLEYQAWLENHPQ